MGYAPMKHWCQSTSAVAVVAAFCSNSLPRRPAATSWWQCLANSHGQRQPLQTCLTRFTWELEPISRPTGTPSHLTSPKQSWTRAHTLHRACGPWGRWKMRDGVSVADRCYRPTLVCTMFSLWRPSADDVQKARPASQLRLATFGSFPGRMTSTTGSIPPKRPVSFRSRCTRSARTSVKSWSKAWDTCLGRSLGRPRPTRTIARHRIGGEHRRERLSRASRLTRRSWSNTWWTTSLECGHSGVSWRPS